MVDFAHADLPGNSDFDMTVEPRVFYEFGPFRVDPDRQLLLREGQPIAVTPKAFETLLILLRRSREVVSKEELIKTVWPDSFIKEANLSQNIFVLRKALGNTSRRSALYRYPSGPRIPLRRGGAHSLAVWRGTPWHNRVCPACYGCSTACREPHLPFKRPRIAGVFGPMVLLTTGVGCSGGPGCDPA